MFFHSKDGTSHPRHLYAGTLLRRLFKRGRCRPLLGLSLVLALRESLMIGVDHRLVELLPEFLGHRKADVLVLTVPRFIAGHGHEQSLAAVHHLDMRMAKQSFRLTDAIAFILPSGRMEPIFTSTFIGSWFCVFSIAISPVN